MADSTPQITAAFGAPIRQYPGQVQVTRAVKVKVPGKEGALHAAFHRHAHGGWQVGSSQEKLGGNLTKAEAIRYKKKIKTVQSLSAV